MSAPLGSYFFRSVSSAAGSGMTGIAFATFSPSGSWTTNTTYTGGYSRLGEYMFMSVKLALAGAPNNAGSLTVNLPSGFSLDLGKIQSSGTLARTGIVSQGVLNASSAFPVFATVNDAVSVILGTYTVAGGGSFITRGALSATLPVALVNGNDLTIWAEFPIIGWAP